MSGFRACVAAASQVPAGSGYASLIVNGGVTPQTINLAVAKLTAFATAGESDDIVASVVNSNITIQTAGVYTGGVFVSFSGTPNTTFELHAYLNGVEMDSGVHRKLATGGDVGSSGFTIAPQTFSAGDVIDVRVNNLEGNGRSMTVVDAQFTLFRLA